MADISLLKTLAKYVYDTVNGTDKMVTVALFYDDATVYLKELLALPDAVIRFVEIEDCETDSYDREFIISASGTEEGKVEVWCEKAFDADSHLYFSHECDALYIGDDVTHEIARKCNTLNWFTLSDFAKTHNATRPPDKKADAKEAIEDEDDDSGSFQNFVDASCELIWGILPVLTDVYNEYFKK